MFDFVSQIWFVKRCLDFQSKCIHGTFFAKREVSHFYSFCFANMLYVFNYIAHLPNHFWLLKKRGFDYLIHFISPIQFAKKVFGFDWFCSAKIFLQRYRLWDFHSFSFANTFHLVWNYIAKKFATKIPNSSIRRLFKIWEK